MEEATLGSSRRVLFLMLPRQVTPQGSLDFPELPLVPQLKSLCRLVLPLWLSQAQHLLGFTLSLRLTLRAALPISPPNHGFQDKQCMCLEVIHELIRGRRLLLLLGSLSCLSMLGFPYYLPTISSGARGHENLASMSGADAVVDGLSPTSGTGPIFPPKGVAHQAKGWTTLLGTVGLATDRSCPLPPQMWPQAPSPASGRDLMTSKASDSLPRQRQTHLDGLEGHQGLWRWCRVGIGLSAPFLVPTHGNWACPARVISHSLLPKAGQKTDLVKKYVGEWGSRNPFMPSWALGLGLRHHQQGEAYPQELHVAGGGWS